MLIFQVFWKHWPRLFGYFWGDAKSTNGCRSAPFPPGTTSSAKPFEDCASGSFFRKDRPDFSGVFHLAGVHYDQGKMKGMIKMAKTSTKIIVGLTSMACFTGFAAYTNHYDSAKGKAVLSDPAGNKAIVQQASTKEEPLSAALPAPAPAKEILLATAPVVTDVTAKPAAPAAAVSVQADAAVNTPPDSAPAPEPAPAKKKNTKTRAS